MGRKLSLMLSIIIMSITTLVIATLPTYQHIGIMAPIILITMRILQGLSLGGEYSGAIITLTEFAPKNKKAFYSSIAIASSTLGMLLGASISLLIISLLPQEHIQTFGWRIAFFIGGIIALTGLYIRQKINETPEFIKIKNNKKTQSFPSKILFLKYKISLFIGTIIGTSISSMYIIIGPFTTYIITKVLEQDMFISSLLTYAALLTSLITCLISGYISNKISPHKILIFSSILLIISAYPIMYLISLKDFLILQLLSEVMLGGILGLSSGTLGIILYAHFPISIRFTGTSCANNLNAMLIFGTSPFILSTQYITHFSLYTTISLYLIFSAIITLCAATYATLSIPNSKQY